MSKVLVSNESYFSVLGTALIWSHLSQAIVLSGLNEKAGESLSHIRKLYEETKDLKIYLEKVSACNRYPSSFLRAVGLTLRKYI